MAGDRKPIDQAVTWLRNHRQTALIGGVALIMVIGIVASLAGGGEEPAIAGASTTLAATAAATTMVDASEFDHPDVPPISCETLITNDDAFEVMFPSGSGGLFTFAMGETCTYDPDDGSGMLIRIEPGLPSDFDAGTELLGASGLAVPDIGDGAVWFAGTGGDTGAGLLAVREGTELGALFFRVTVSLPDLDDAGRLEQAVSLAGTALPRFPGVVVEPPEPELITFDDQEVDLSPYSLDDLLYGGVETGDWTLGEGLVAILDWMVNGTDGVVGGEMSETSGSGVVAVAQAYLATEPDDAARVQALLDELFVTRDELEQRSELADSIATRLLVSAAPVAQEQTGDPCDGATVAEPCYAELDMAEYPDLEVGKYKVFVAQPSKWTEVEVKLAKEALHDAALTFEGLGNMPSEWLELNPGDALYAGYNSQGCLASMGDFLVGMDPNELKQVFAREISFCLISGDAQSQLKGNPNSVVWLVYGLANYLSDVVYPGTNLEHKNLPSTLAQEELSTSVPDRTWTNWILFEHLHEFMGPGGIMAMIRGFPTQGDLIAALAGVAGMPEMYHDLERALSDSNVADVGPGTIPYEPQAWELPISGPTEVPLEVPRFGVRRLHIKVPAGQYACVDSFTQGAVRMSWRPGAPGEAGSWSDELPFSFEGEAVMVLTSVEPGAEYTLDVTDVGDDPDCDPDSGGGPATPVDCLLGDICGPSDYYFEVTITN
ncbi:MAG: hypothetical protein WCE80_15265 [Acidimicrobiia bacterium]